MNVSWEMTSGLLRRMGTSGMLKSTRDRLDRQEETQKQVDFFEQQKGNLKNVKCNSVEEIAEKLNMLYSYEDQIKAVKAAYNSEQMWHILDESTERGEKIAEAVEKMEPKTPEERQEELVEEALGIEDSGGMLEEILDEVGELTEELTEEMTEELTGEVTQELTGEAEKLTEAPVEEMVDASVQDITVDEEVLEVQAGNLSVDKAVTGMQTVDLEMLKEGYIPFDVRL